MKKKMHSVDFLRVTKPRFNYGMNNSQFCLQKKENLDEKKNSVNF